MWNVCLLRLGEEFKSLFINYIMKNYFSSENLHQHNFHNRLKTQKFRAISLPVAHMIAIVYTKDYPVKNFEKLSYQGLELFFKISESVMSGLYDC